ncbi:long-chain fatty acid--CoA ligase [Novosphingobium umbonatum]|uniref:Long-chain-fatty-acid--CoA ligase n=1 Tax=Novosphingobium umbonatum TaxID=1908524 RepID=A0A437NCM0_9SPHN|nr:long-chain fatty acid--CoA ligase [Novosphingobium umbonatum]RVU07709.1 long-chain fatty acid--CoA ligase [Novosphingobium umbonatum]
MLTEAASIAQGRAINPAPKRIPDLLDHAASLFPERVAVDFLGRTWRYGEIATMVERAARGLYARGLRKGDRFALCLPNTPYYVILYFAALKLGAVVVNLNPLYTERELEHLIKDSGARMVALPDIAAIHNKVKPVALAHGVDTLVMCPMGKILPAFKALGWAMFKRRDHARFAKDGLHIDFCKLVAKAPALPEIAVSPDDLAVLQYTGGTTGVPKGAMLSHANLTANAAQMLDHLGHDIGTPERILGVLPMFHVFALTTVLNFAIEIAAEIVLLPRFELSQMLDTMRRKPPTIIFGVPTIWVAMINGIPKGQAPDLSHLTACVSGGAPLPLEVREEFEALTGAVLTEGYGLTEASPIITCNPIDGLIKTNSCGQPFPATQIEIRNPEKPEEIMPLGEKGEVCARGPQVMMGYWQRPEDTAKTFTQGALRTGDIGYLDGDGYLFLVDRIKDVILCGGFNVYPRIIEDAAYLHPAVEEAIAIGIPDQYRGQAPKLFVKLHASTQVTPEELKSFLLDHVSKIEVPKEIEIRASLPKTLVGKLSKKELVEEERLKREGASKS